MNPAFWETIPLHELTPEQWELLCDGCGKCCLEKFEDEETGRIIYSRVACALLDPATARCRHYAERRALMPDCMPLDLKALARPQWLPESCAYRRLAERRSLPPWHPLITGDPESVARAGESVRGRVIGPEKGAEPIYNLIDWIR
ncbi:YcgN family cysteine cluster protein [Caldichromatium japonicum]|uniref:YcgN family cysteine cluster protein n=1 Tax=Caldichromatium japonicum TaxID=2699430 RepID=A0A6G7VEW7_9GAMM|nr:YcgN family cysteine cluster protein [Caldichromatium japonicum]QIK38425.1 YcgN family cysteine cluster protein [Caldichromatium japonicum]